MFLFMSKIVMDQIYIFFCLYYYYCFYLKLKIIIFNSNADVAIFNVNKKNILLLF